MGAWQRRRRTDADRLDPFEKEQACMEYQRWLK